MSAPLDVSVSATPQVPPVPVGSNRNQLDKRLKLTDPERRALAEKAVLLGKLMADTVTIVKPETILKWHRRLVAREFDGTKFRKCGRAPITLEVEELIVNMPKDSPS